MSVPAFVAPGFIEIMGATSLPLSGEASDKTIKELAGHVSPRMLKHYSHIRTAAKRKAVEAIVSKKEKPAEVATAPPEPETMVKEVAKVSRLN